jgi:hypothetical protein
MIRDGRDCVAAIDALHAVCDLEQAPSQRSTTDQVAFEFVLALISPWLAKGVVSKTFVNCSSA